MKHKSIVIFLSQKDFDEQEFIITKSQLIKNNYNVFICSDATTVCIGNRGLKVKNDVLLNNLKQQNFAGLVIIGGKGITDYFKNTLIINNITEFIKNKKVVAAICAAPVLLAKTGLLTNKPITSNINYIKDIEKEGAIFVDEPFFVNENIVTAKEAIYANDFITKFIHLLKNKN